MNFRFLNRHNRCEMSGTCQATGKSFHRRNGIYPCFHAAFEFVDENGVNITDISYKLYMKKRCDQINNNFVILDKKNLTRLLRVFKEVIPFHYHFIEDRREPGYLILELTLSGTRLQHKSLLMLSRLLFEYPHNLCAYDALKLRTMKVPGVNMRKFSIISLYMLCLSSYSFSTDECIIRHNHPKLKTVKELKTAFKRKDRKTISAVIKRKEFEVGTLATPRNVDAIYSDADFERRKAVYIETIKSYLDA